MKGLIMPNEYILALIPIIVPFLIALAFHLYNLLLAHLPQNKQDLLLSVAQTAVTAAQQSGVGNVNKKQFAEEAVNAGLKTAGVNIDPLYINAAIESAVLALKQEMAKVAPATIESDPKLSSQVQ
jgi:basic membrane lipoprotein Med (substrate-binding protein (PBP1-ABC) superfamily)